MDGIKNTIKSIAKELHLELKYIHVIFSLRTDKRSMIKSSTRMECRLMNSQMQSKKKLNKLIIEKLQEEMALLKQKPNISLNSQRLIKSDHLPIYTKKRMQRISSEKRIKSWRINKNLSNKEDKISISKTKKNQSQKQKKVKIGRAHV